MKALVAIGCDEYINPGLEALSGAENDAEDIFNALVEHENSIYEKDHSILLKSPSLQEAKESLSQVIFETVESADISVFFAGHGGVKDGSYYLCVKDTVVDRLSLTALSMTEMFMWINEASIRDSNIVIDACQAGGMAKDVATFLKPNDIGRLGSPSVSVLVAAASDQSAREVDSHGVATAALLHCLSGDITVQNYRPGLNLSEIGHALSEKMEADKHQSPVFWGLNLFGRSVFSFNPHYKPSAEFDVYPHGLDIDAQAVPIVRKHASSVWQLYLSTTDHFDVQSFINLSQELLEDITEGENIHANIIDALVTTFRPLVGESDDPFEEIELLGACISALLPYSEKKATENIILNLSCQLIDSINMIVANLIAALKDNKYALLSRSGALADLYYLPIRILKILGWISACHHIAKITDALDKYDLDMHKLAIRLILEHYVTSIVAVSDEQTCNIVMFLFEAGDMGLEEEAEQVFGVLCNTFHKYQGKISWSNTTGENAYKFIKSRLVNNCADQERLVAKPNELISALILAANDLSLSDVVDNLMKDFDHLPGNIFVPDRYLSFADKHIDDGTNYSYTIGHGVWCVDDVVKNWKEIRTKINKDKHITIPSVETASICAALISSNRSPWFIVK